LYAVNGSSSLNALCRKYGIADVSRSIFSKCVWNVFISSISVYSFVYIFVCFWTVIYTVLCELRLI